MPSTIQDAPSNVTEPRRPVKRKRETRPSAASSKNNTPNAYARRSPPPSSHQRREDSSPPHKLKRPGAGARISAAMRDAAIENKRRAEVEDAKAGYDSHAAYDPVASHYNAVPQYGRDYRKTESKIKGLRSLNNWVKSTLIQKFSRPEIPVQELLVLDMACGKGGDLGKWEKAPQVPALYVGCDIAEQSVEDARGRYNETLRRNNGRHRRHVMDAQFYVHDTFGKPMADIPIVRQVGFNPNAGPGSGVIQGGMASGGFDVVSMMFALHYSFKSEELARGMLKNVAGALKKGGRFIGVLPDSDVIGAAVRRLTGSIEHDGNTGMPAPADDDEDEWDPEAQTVDAKFPSSLATAQQLPEIVGSKTLPPGAADEEDEWDPEVPTLPAAVRPLPVAALPPSETMGSTTPLPPLEWGNSLYNVRLDRSNSGASLPSDGTFRPAFGWSYSYELEEAVNNLVEYVVPWEALRALAEEYGLELLYRKPFGDVLRDEALPGTELGSLAERMGVKGRNGELLVGEEEMEAASFYHAFCFYRT